LVIDQKHYGPTALVTGASDGIGRAFASELAAAGFHLVLVARRGSVLDEVAREISARHNITTRVVAADLASRTGVQQVIDATKSDDIGLIVLSAGFGTSGNFVDGIIDDELQMIDVNCRAVAELSHHFGKRLAQRKRGGLVLLSSLVAFQGVPRTANYAATKAYVQSLAEGLQHELRPHGVDVVASAPGPVGSGFAQRAQMQMGKTTPGDVVARQTLAALGRKTTVRPGWLSKLLGWSLAFLPRVGRVRVMSVVMGGMTKHR
jgi:uncharacterized protein